MLNDTNQLRKAQEQYDAIGSEFRCWRMPSAAAAGEAYAKLNERASDEAASVSGWRFASPDRSESFVAVAGERADLVARCALLIEASGGVPYELPDEYVEAMRQRRRNVIVETFARGGRTMDEHAHYGDRGAYLRPDGTMEPGS